jgi:hypothetical protein
MNNFLGTIREGLSRIRKVWIITAIVVLGLVLGLAGFASGTIGKAIAALQGKTAVSAVDVQAAGTPTMAAMPGMLATATAMPGMVMPTETTAAGQPASGNDMDALLMQMQQTMQSLQGMMGQLEQQSANPLPTATPVVAQTINLQPYMAELQDINQTMIPLLQRIQADLQGKPSAEELANVRAQVAQIQGRMMNLMNQLQAARNGTVAAAPAPTVDALPGMGNMSGTGMMQPAGVGPMNQTEAMNRLDALMQQMQHMLHQMQSQQQAGNLPAGGMNGGNMSSQPGQMDNMMTMMDNMMSMMDNMMGGMSNQSGPMNGMNMATPTPMAGMSSSNSPSSSMMDGMMMMMDNMMQMMDNMMAMPDM